MTTTTTITTTMVMVLIVWRYLWQDANQKCWPLTDIYKTLDYIVSSPSFTVTPGMMISRQCSTSHQRSPSGEDHSSPHIPSSRRNTKHRIEQAGFRPGRNTQEQVLALTTYVENGYQRRDKTGVVVLDLTAAYDIVSHKGMLVKLSKVLPCWAVSVIELLFGQRLVRVHMGDISSSWNMQKNGLPQGSGLTPTLFNLYIIDLPVVTCRKFIYADICLAHQARNFEDLNTTNNADIAKISDCSLVWPKLCRALSVCTMLELTKSWT